MKRIGIIQSNYIPWKGYFDIIHDVDLFVFYDDVQYTKRDWRNRNCIKTPMGERWQTIPVGKNEGRICDVRLPDSNWARDHWRQIKTSYRSAPYFERYREYFEVIYLASEWRWLSELNQTVIMGIARDLLGITTEFTESTAFQLTATKGARILELLDHTSADLYVSGPAARNYITDAEFAAAGIEVVWKDYSGYPEYEQLHPPFSHHVTILDLLFHTGPRAPWYIWGWRSDAAARKAA